MAEKSKLLGLATKVSVLKELSSIRSACPLGSRMTDCIRQLANRRPPIYTLRLPGIRLYVVDSATLIPSVQKQVKTISFAPVMVKMAESIVGSSKSALKIMSRDLLDDHGHISGVAKIIHATLLPGTRLDALNRRSVQFVKVSMDALASRIGEAGANGHTTISLYQWANLQVMMATTEGIYGPQNPFRDDTVVQAFR